VVRTVYCSLLVLSHDDDDIKIGQAMCVRVHVARYTQQRFPNFFFHDPVIFIFVLRDPLSFFRQYWPIINIKVTILISFGDD